MQHLAILNDVTMHAGQRAVVRVRVNPDQWEYGLWHKGEFRVMADEFAEKLALSPLSTSFQSQIVGQQAFEAWLFDDKDYDTAYMEVKKQLYDMQHSQKLLSKPIPWWKRLFGKYA